MSHDVNVTRTGAHESTEGVPARAVIQWLREPDYAEEFSLAAAIDWINRRPLAEVHRLYMHHAETIKERDALVKALECARDALAEAVAPTGCVGFDSDLRAIDVALAAAKDTP